MHIDFLVEDFSTEAALNNLLPKLLPTGIEYGIRSFQGKEDLLKQLPNLLKAYKSWMPDEYRIVVLVDRDNDDCKTLKGTLENCSLQAGFSTKTTQNPGYPFQVLNRLMIEELEAWFFGDITALCQAYPGIKPSLAQKSPYRDPDGIKGGTWEALERELQRVGHFKGRLDKLKAAREISAFMEPERNKSTSFQVFCDGLISLIEVV